MNFKSLITLMFISYFFFACKGGKSEYKYVDNINGNEFAKYFQISNRGDSSEIVVMDSWSSSDKCISLKINPIKNPTCKIVCMSTSHIAYLTALGLESKIAGVSGKQYISDADILIRIEKGEILDIGYEGSLNYEFLLRLKPDVVFTYGIAGENNIYIEKIKDLGIVVIALGDYLENHPLGKLEYLKLFGKLFNCTSRADSIFNSVKERYVSLKQIVINPYYRPKVLLNAPWKEIWYIPGYNNYMSVLIRDAGGDPILSKQGESASIAYSLEEVYQKSMIADYWLNPNNYSSIIELKKSNPLFKNIPSLRNAKVYNNTKRGTFMGGSDFWEKGVVEPDVILNDLINILHPELKTKRELVYYKKLK